jgi:hypothetical protein
MQPGDSSIDEARSQQLAALRAKLGELLNQYKVLQKSIVRDASTAGAYAKKMDKLQADIEACTAELGACSVGGKSLEEASSEEAAQASCHHIADILLEVGRLVPESKK